VVCGYKHASDGSISFIYAFLMSMFFVFDLVHT
jgi:hypothetical protein